MISWMAPVQIGRPNPPAVDRIIREKAENCPGKVVSECWSKGIIKAQGPPEKSLLFLIFDLNKVSTVIAPAALCSILPAQAFSLGVSFSAYGLHFEEAVTIIPEARKFWYNCMVSLVWFRSITVTCKRTHPMPAGPGSQPEGQRKSFFLKELIRKIVLND